MRKTTVYIPDELKRRLEETARIRRRSEAEIIRAALESFTVGVEAAPPRLPLFPTLGEPIADRVDEILSESFGAD